MEKKKLKIRDLTLRDGQQSLFATRLRQEDIDPLLPLYKDAGFYIMEVWGGAVPDSVMRYLDESPWNRLRTIAKAIDGRSMLSALSRGRNLFGYVPYPDSVLKGFYEEAIKNGLDIMRIFDALNDIDNVKESIRLINELGGKADTAVCYTVDPKDDNKEKIFTDDYFVLKAVQMERLGAWCVTLKDMAGLVSPLRAKSLITALKANVNVPVDFHTHCTPGYGLASSLMAILAGVDILDTNIWWFGEGSAAPAIELIYLFCKKLGIEVDVNMEKVGEIRDLLEGVRRRLSDVDLNKDHFPKHFDPLKDELPPEVDVLFYRAIAAALADDEEALLENCHAIEDYFGFPKPNLLVKNAEVPGGMYSNMVANLRALKAEDLIEDAMKLIPKVRRDAGLVPLVTPTSQIVGAQAVNLVMDRRNGKPDYSSKSNQFISLVKGEYGHTPVAIDPEFRKQITGDAEEHPYDVSKYQKPENPTITVTVEVPSATNKEEELLIELLPNVANKFLHNRREEEVRDLVANGVIPEGAKKVEKPAAKAEAPKAEAPKAAPAKKAAAPAAPVEKKPVTGKVFVAPMGGKIVEIDVKAGDKVKKGQKLMVYEAMKMENDLEADQDMLIKQVLVVPDQIIDTDEALIEFE